jgi:hypothetical protein
VKNDPDAVRCNAVKLLSLVNGAAQLVLREFEPVELGEAVDWVHPNGRLKRRLRETIVLRIRSGSQVSVDEGNRALGKAIQDYMTVARQDARFADVLRIWGSRHPHSWDTLYKLKEKIEAAVGLTQIVQRGWATESELRRFGHTANSYAVLGDSARHGVQTSQPPPSPMTCEEAQQLVERLIRSWLDLN